MNWSQDEDSIGLIVTLVLSVAHVIGHLFDNADGCYLQECSSINYRDLILITLGK
jgi:hypothetical protein